MPAMLRTARSRVLQRRWVWLIVISVAAFALRVNLSWRSGLWVDEVFSLAMATGHSVEQLPTHSHADLGDFVVPATPQPAAAFAAFAEQDRVAAGLGRVLRATLLSDTNPPLYYGL